MLKPAFSDSLLSPIYLTAAKRLATGLEGHSTLLKMIRLTGYKISRLCPINQCDQPYFYIPKKKTRQSILPGIFFIRFFLKGISVEG